MKKKKGLTLTEVLLAMTVIGIIAVIAGLIINPNIKKAEIETKLKHTSAILNNALHRAITEHGPAYTWDIVADRDNSSNSNTTYFKTYIAPYITQLKPATTTTLKELGYPKGIKQPNGSMDMILKDNYKGTMFFFNNGTIILNTIYSVTSTNPNYTSYTNSRIVHTIDINGSKGPNIFGKDVFRYEVNLIEETPRVVMAGRIYTNALKYDETGEITLQEYSRNTLLANCRTQGYDCGALIEMNAWKVPKDYPLKL